SSRRRHTRSYGDWSSDVCSSDLNATGYTYDEVGHLAVTTAPTVNTEINGGTPVATHPITTVGYDTFDETVETDDPNGNVTTTGYDADGRPVSVTAPTYTPPGGTAITAVARKTYTPLSQVATATNPLGYQSTYRYDNIGETTSMTDAASNLTRYSYDYAGHTTKTTLPDGTAVTATFDAAGRQTGTAGTDTDGATILAAISTGYDNNGNTTST